MKILVEGILLFILSLVFFLLFLAYRVNGAVENFGCQQVTLSIDNSTGTAIYTKNYINCSSEPVLNITENITVVRNITIVNQTFNETDVLLAFNQTLKSQEDFRKINDSYNSCQSVLTDIIAARNVCQAKISSFDSLNQSSQLSANQVAVLQKQIVDADNLGWQRLLIGFGVGAAIVYLFGVIKPKFERGEVVRNVSEETVKTEGLKLHEEKAKLETTVSSLEQKIRELEKRRGRRR